MTPALCESRGPDRKEYRSMQQDKPSIDNDNDAIEDPSHLRIATASWPTAFVMVREGLDLVPVRTSRGVPKFWPAAEGFPYVAELAPDGWMLSLNVEQFRSAYLAKLDRIGLEAISDRLAAIETEQDSTLMLCCFEAARADCHRGLFADWWQDRTGRVVPEVGAEAENER
jgi:hypothetical protein